MTITQLASKHNIDPVAFRLAVQEWIDGQRVICYEVTNYIPHEDPFLDKKGYTNKLCYPGTFDRDPDKVTPLIARPSLLEE